MNVLLETPFGLPWLSLAEPSDILTASRPADVGRCLENAEAAARGGNYVAGFVTYEAAAAWGLAVREPPAGGLPLACFGIFPASAVEALEDPAAHLPESAGDQVLSWAPTIDRSLYAAAVRRIKEHIAEGDTYQLNFTFRLRAPFAGDARALFGRLFAAQRGSWSAYLDLGTHVICSASPELFFLRDGSHIECRPMKGTWPRGLTSAGDAAHAARLRTSPKNRSENVMIVDLMRNDLGRVADVGSVTVASLFDVERYPAQWQMTSTVAARTRAPLADVFAALFPSGSVTGAPKARSMEIIRALESSPRGIYTGAIGLIAPDGRAHFNVAIRTVVVDRSRQEAEFGVGSGIVWESQEADEFDECQVKAAILTARLPEFELLETLRWDTDGTYVLLERHMERLRQSAGYFGFAYDDERARRALADAAIGRTMPSRVRLLVDVRGAARCEATDLVARPGPLRAALARSPVSRDDVFLYHKTTRRVVHDGARASRPDADAVLMWNDVGDVTESTDANVIVEIDGRRVTPPVECGLLAGTLRAELLERGEIVEQRVTTDDLRRATGLWLINSVRGWIDVTLI